MWGGAAVREYRLAKSGTAYGVSCGADGAYVGPVPLLERRLDPNGRQIWAPRGQSELESDLTDHYGVPIDVSAKAGGLQVVAEALNKHDIARAQVATLHLHFPDLPPLAKSVRSDQETLALAAALYWSDLLKGDWDPDKHPRLGQKPNPGWFAPVPNEPKPPAPGWPFKKVNRALREAIKKYGGRIVARLGRRGGLSFLGPLGEVIEEFSPTELNRGEDRILAQIESYKDPPKTLEELQVRPANTLGYDLHHIVEGNDDNREKFGDAAIDDPSNLVWVPRLKHEDITSEYNTGEKDDLERGTKRERINELDFAAQREEGLKALRDNGVLK